MEKIFLFVLSFAIIIWLSFILFLKWNTPKIIITPEQALFDESIDISISNLAAHEQITLEISFKDDVNNTWLSRATFKADENGVVNVATQSPVSGSYRGIDPMGLFWSMTRKNKKAPLVVDSKKSETVITLSLFSQDKLRTTKTISRLLVSPDIERRKVREHGIVGTLFYPKNKKNVPGIIVIPGSNGGIPETISQLLASHGYAVLALGYFGVEGLSKKVENTPLEYFQNAIQWFKKQPQVSESRIAFLGHSKGAELALLLAATFPEEINAVIANAPTSLVYGGIPDETKPAWTYKGSPIPFMPSLGYKQALKAAKEGKIPFHKGTFEDPYEETPIFLYGMKEFHENIDAATIPVENIRCPIMLISGEDDKMFPSTLHGNLIMERLDKKGSTVERKHLHFPDAGHVIRFPYVPSSDLAICLPVVNIWFVFGGTAEGNARANKESWQEVLNFLKKTLQ